MMQLHNTDGFKFYRSANDVILCPGDENGLLPPKYFSEVRALPSGRIEVVLWFLKQKSPQLLSKKDFTYILLDLEFMHHSWHLILFLLTPVLFPDSFTCTDPSPVPQTHYYLFTSSDRW